MRFPVDAITTSISPGDPASEVTLQGVKDSREEKMKIRSLMMASALATVLAVPAMAQSSTLHRPSGLFCYVKNGGLSGRSAS